MPAYKGTNRTCETTLHRVTEFYAKHITYQQIKTDGRLNAAADFNNKFAQQ